MIGAIVVSAAYEVRGPGSFHWHISQFVQLRQPFVLETSHFQYRTAYAKLKPEVVAEVARAPVSVGGSLGSHFPEGDQSRWLLLKIPASGITDILLHDFMFPLCATTEMKYLRGLGVLPDIVGILPDPVKL